MDMTSGTGFHISNASHNTVLTLSYINSKGEPLTGGFHIPCHSYSSCSTFLKEAEQCFSEGKDYILRDEMNNVTLIAHKWHHLDDVYYAKLEVAYET